METLIDKITNLILTIRQLKDDFLNTCDISYVDLDMKGKSWVSFGGILSGWGDSNQEQLNLQIKIKEHFKLLDDYFNMIEPKMPIEKFRNIQKA